MNLFNKNILVLGLAKTGIYTIKHLDKLGAKIIVNDLKTKEELSLILEELEDIKNIQYILGKHISGIYNFDLAIISPGIPLDLPFIKELQNEGIKIIGEVELGYRLAMIDKVVLNENTKQLETENIKKPTFIGITGTNGKTTTTSLIGEIFKNDEKDTHIAGNIGNPVINTVDLLTNESFIITELSSFQLETIDSFKPKISVFLNISEDHLNRHHTLENYIKAKSNIFKNQTPDDFIILNYDDPKVRALHTQCNATVIFFSRKNELHRGVYVNEAGDIVINIDKEVILMNKADLSLPGSHNLENALAAIACAYIERINLNALKHTLKTFNPIEHRQEVVRSVDGVTFINDSKATNPESTIKAIESYTNPIVLILGGLNKNSNFDELLDLAKEKTKSIVLMGECANDLFKLANKKGFKDIAKTIDLASAVTIAKDIADKGDIVLFSPACASWDSYKNFEERGKDFKLNVNKL